MFLYQVWKRISCILGISPAHETLQHLSTKIACMSVSGTSKKPQTKQLFPQNIFPLKNIWTGANISICGFLFTKIHILKGSFHLQTSHCDIAEPVIIFWIYGLREMQHLGQTVFGSETTNKWIL